MEVLNIFTNEKDVHNVMVFVGNGFDIKVLNRYRNDNVTTTFSKFFEFLQFIGHDENLLIDAMLNAKDLGRENWSDFEALIPELANRNNVKKINNSLKELQGKFALFLSKIVTPDIETRLSEDTMKNDLSINSLSKFLKDLKKEDYLKMNFPQKTDHYHFFNYLFINFNYTSLLDNYIYLDKKQHDPHPYKTSYSNFTFYPNPNSYGKGTNEKTGWSSIVKTEVIHPHGQQQIPRSLLFGTTNRRLDAERNLQKLNKNYWASYDENYGDLIDMANLYIIYGSSIGESDSWWWNKICSNLNSEDPNTAPELIIYSYEKDFDKSQFVAKYSNNLSDKEKARIISHIYVVRYNNDNENIFLSLN